MRTNKKFVGFCSEQNSSSSIWNAVKHETAFKKGQFNFKMNSSIGGRKHDKLISNTRFSQVITLLVSWHLKSKRFFYWNVLNGLQATERSEFGKSFLKNKSQQCNMYCNVLNSDSFQNGTKEIIKNKIVRHNQRQMTRKTVDICLTEEDFSGASFIY